MSSLMKPSRRSMLAGVAATLVAVPAAAVEFSALDQLIADHRWATEAADAAVVSHWNLEANVELPAVIVRYGKRRITDPETGEVSWGQWEFHSRGEIRRHFDPILDVWAADSFFPHNIAGLRADRDACLSEIERQEKARAAAERAAGITAAHEAADRACDHAERLRDEIIAYRPVTMAEVAAKNAFLLKLMVGGLMFTDDELMKIFAATPLPSPVNHA